MKRKILITGAGTGIGRDAAFALAQRGHHVIATTFSEEQARALLAECKLRGQALEVFKLDISLPDDRRLLTKLEPDVLVNNAAVGEAGSLAEVDVERIRAAFEVNVFSTIALTQEVLRGMIARESGTVVFVSSLAGRVPMPFLMPYSMTKFALSAAGAGLRAEMDQLGKNVQITLIEPGAFQTGFNQSMVDRQFDPARSSYFSAQESNLKAKGARALQLLERRSTKSVVAKIVRATEAKRPKLRYVAPWSQGLMVRFARMLNA
ncbi:SDR family NAD(P)-dependent oxidoreductase [Bradyrhizobium nitroreducens]|uniref:SDR family NAD(P)-dependent oxidoreductase n=1 Tax=Bradyrhizobium nitroreducens TaxID=709803 RepID=UPI001374AE8C|nr:SDR family NAD(P)-dependent oxidoreductase [Bradyrhizobium nitroreducens]